MASHDDAAQSPFGYVEPWSLYGSNPPLPTGEALLNENASADLIGFLDSIDSDAFDSTLENSLAFGGMNSDLIPQQTTVSTVYGHALPTLFGDHGLPNSNFGLDPQMYMEPSVASDSTYSHATPVTRRPFDQLQNQDTELNSMFNGHMSQNIFGPQGVSSSNLSSRMTSADDRTSKGGGSTNGHNFVTDQLSAINIQPNQLNGQSTNGSMRSHSFSQHTNTFPRRQQEFLPRTTEESRHIDYYKRMVFGSESDTPMTRRSELPTEAVQFGTDKAFGDPRGFNSPDPSIMAATRRNTHSVIHSLTFNPDPADDVSAESTRPSTPVTHTNTNTQRMDSVSNINGYSHNKKSQQRTSRDGTPNTNSELETDEEEAVEESASAPTKSQSDPRKRKAPNDTDKSTPRSKSKPISKRRKSSAEPSSKASKSTATGRRNLTKEEKKQNHIRSEKTRRAKISMELQNLADACPAVEMGSMSRKVLLHGVADWMEKLVEGNEELKKVLERLEAGKGSKIEVGETGGDKT